MKPHAHALINWQLESTKNRKINADYPQKRIRISKIKIRPFEPRRKAQSRNSLLTSYDNYVIIFR